MTDSFAFLAAAPWNIPQAFLDAAASIEKSIATQSLVYESTAAANELKVLRAFHAAGICESHLHETRGYGYFDSGRDALERVYAAVFAAEDALVRPQIVSGTHALKTALHGILRPGDTLLFIPARPYDTLRPLFGLEEAAGSLKEWGIQTRGAGVEEAAHPGFKEIEPSAVFIQRSKGYRWQPSISISQMTGLIRTLKSKWPQTRVLVDNCYGEFAEEREPAQAGADLIAGSLLKNPGGGLAGTGGYLAGKADLIRRAAASLTAPGLEKEVGPSLHLKREFFQGLFLAPGFVREALKTARFAAELFKRMGYPVNPEPGDSRTDIIQAVELGSRAAVMAFARGIQKAGPLDQNAIPLGAALAGYADEIVMSGGTFVQGGSLELSCDAPLRPPYTVYVQGGLSSVQGKLGILLAAKEVAQARQTGEKESPVLQGI